MAAYYSRREYEKQQSYRASGSATGTFCSMLTVLLIGLKLTGHFAHSWWLVWAPIWAPCAIYLALAIGAGVIAVAVAAWHEHAARKRRAAAAAEKLQQQQVK
jgi:hypothetical protein